MKFAALRSSLISHLSFLILILLSTFYLLSSAAHTYASSQTTPVQSTQYPTPNTNPDVPNNLHNWTQSVMIEVMSSLTCQIAGVDPINPKQSCLGADQKTGKIGFLPSPQTGGAIGFMGTMISTLYTPPLHTADYFQNLAQNFGISKKTYAAPPAGGTGFQSLSPLINIWSAFRNIVYLLLVIVFVVIGLAIMLRVKIDPRTVMTIQNQIPKIIIGILAVTFSFAIAGFLIDMMWVLIYLIFGVFSGISPEIAKSLETLNPSSIQGQTAMGVSNHISTGGIWGITGNVSVAIGNIISLFLFGFDGKTLIAVGSVGTIIGATVGFIVGGPLGALLGGAGLGGGQMLLVGVGVAIAFVIIIIALLTALFRLWFTLLMAYVQILLAVVLAPFWIIGGIVPGSPISLGGWFKNMAANLLAFPVTLAMFMLGKVFMDAFSSGQTSGQFVPPLIGNPGSQGLIGSLIGLGIILMTPNVVNMLKSALKVAKIETGLGKAIGGAVGIPVSTGKNIGSTIMGSKEYIAGPKGFEQRTLGTSILGGIFGRR